VEAEAEAVFAAVRSTPAAQSAPAKPAARASAETADAGAWKEF
jgi:methyl-accepting chemotaxis protein-1 (serine sensor receptor)